MPIPVDSTRRILDAYVEQTEAPMFLHGFFQSPPKNFHNSELVEIDVQRDSDEVAVVIQDISTGARQNELGGYTTKAFQPPVYDEEATISTYELLKRGFGEDPLEDPNFQAKAVVRAFAVYRKLEAKIRRAIEIQASQVLQTGKLLLTDAAGNPAFSLDFGPRAENFPTVGTPWAADGNTGDPMGDIASLAEVVRRTGRREPRTLVFGSTALQRWLANRDVKAQLANVGMQQFAQLRPETRGQGATFYGRFFIRNYWYDVFSYSAEYQDPVTKDHVPYVDPNKVIMISEGARLDCSFGAIPRLVPPDPRVAAFMPTRISASQQGIDLSTFVWITADGKHLKVSAGTRPLCIPTAIDTFGALDIAA